MYKRQFSLCSRTLCVSPVRSLICAIYIFALHHLFQNFSLREILNRAMMKSRRSLAASPLTIFGYLIALPLLVPAGAAFLIEEIVIRKHFVVIVDFIPHCLLSKIQMDFLKFSSAARLHILA